MLVWTDNKFNEDNEARTNKEREKKVIVFIIVVIF